MHHHLITAFMFKFIAEVALAVTNAVVLNEIGTPIVVKRETMPISSNNQNNHKCMMFSFRSFGQLKMFSFGAQNAIDHGCH
jgi:hypothetical protein